MIFEGIMFKVIDIVTQFSIRGFRSPGMYVQGRGILNYLGKLIRRYGKKALILLSPTAKYVVGDTIERSLKNYDVYRVYTVFNRECSWEEIKRVTKIALENNVDIVLGVGGGKALDTAKAVAILNDLVAVLIPTIASTDAPSTGLSVIYTEPYPGEFLEVLFLPRNPDMIVVDSEVISKTPPRFLAAGMGDASAHYWEARSVLQGNKPNLIPLDPTEKEYTYIKPFDIGFIIASRIWEVLKMYGVEAMDSARMKIVSPALEEVIYVVTLLSGLAGENGGTALAHAIGNALSVLEKKMKPIQYHGEMVAFGTLVEIIAEGTLEDAKEYVCWAHSVGLPTSFKELGIEDVTEEDLYKVAEKAMTTIEIHRIPYDISKDALVDLMKLADQVGRKFTQIYPRQSYE
jgi:glycerol dehydrogenase